MRVCIYRVGIWHWIVIEGWGIWHILCVKSPPIPHLSPYRGGWGRNIDRCIIAMCIIFISTIKERGSASHVIIKIILGAYIYSCFYFWIINPFQGSPSLGHKIWWEQITIVGVMLPDQRLYIPSEGCSARCTYSLCFKKLSGLLTEAKVHFFSALKSRLTL